MTNAAPPPPPVTPGEDIDDDQDELDNEQMEPSGVQWALWPVYIVLFAFWICVATIPFLILYTIGWMAWELGD